MYFADFQHGYRSRSDLSVEPIEPSITPVEDCVNFRHAREHGDAPRFGVGIFRNAPGARIFKPLKSSIELIGLSYNVTWL